MVGGVVELVLGDARQPLQDAGAVAELDVLETADRDDERVLHDVHRFDPAAQPGAEPDLDDATKAILVAREELAQRIALSRARAAHELERMLQRGQLRGVGDGRRGHRTGANLAGESMVCCLSPCRNHRCNRSPGSTAHRRRARSRATSSRNSPSSTGAATLRRSNDGCARTYLTPASCAPSTRA